MDHKFSKRIHGYHSLKHMRVDRKFKTKKYREIRYFEHPQEHSLVGVIRVYHEPNPEI
jgi:hypothetical protein